MFNSLQKGIVDIYYTKTPNISSESPILPLSILNGEERRVYNSYKVEHKKREFLAGRYLIKSILAYYLNIKPEDVWFIQNNYGKLYLRENIGSKMEKQILFNLSHSNGMVACAITLEYEVGVDIEKVDGDLIEIAKRFFSPEEIQYIFNFQDNFKNHTAYRLWTLKEAYIKAKGMGLSLDLKSFNILENNEMYFNTLVPSPDFYLSVAVENKGGLNFKSRAKEIYL